MKDYLDRLSIINDKAERLGVTQFTIDFFEEVYQDFFNNLPTGQQQLKDLVGATHYDVANIIEILAERHTIDHAIFHELEGLLSEWSKEFKTNEKI